MEDMTVRAGVATAVAAVLLLAGCSAAPAVPGATPEEVAQYRADQAKEWWEQSFGGGEQPVVELIETVPQDDWPERMVKCVADAGVEGLSLEGGGLYFDPLPDEDQVLYRAYFVCFQQYPYEINDPAAEGIYSRAQIENLYGYFSQRLAPCLVFLGVPVGPAPTEEEFVDTFYGLTIWNPYFWVQPGGLTWDAIDHECPLPPEPFEFLHP